MDWAVGELHIRYGTTPARFGEVLATIPFMSKVLEAVEMAAKVSAEQRILSDANSVYISSCLASPLDAAAHFSMVLTNPAEFDHAGRLHIQPYHRAGQSHGCSHCPPNLCKGAILQRWLNECPLRRCVYVGDGAGDFCPATRMRPCDVLLARRSPHDSLLRQARSAGVAAQVFE